MLTNYKDIGQSSIIKLEWQDINNITLELVKKIGDSIPDVILAIQRGGLIPAVMLSHSLGVRDVLVYDIRVTVSDKVNSEKVRPIIRPNQLLNRLADKDVLVVDDITGSGETLKAVLKDIKKSSPFRVRSSVCVLNRDNWSKANKCSPESLITYIGKEINGWVKFPWEAVKI